MQLPEQWLLKLSVGLLQTNYKKEKFLFLWRTQLRRTFHTQSFSWRRAAVVRNQCIRHARTHTYKYIINDIRKDEEKNKILSKHLHDTSIFVFGTIQRRWKRLFQHHHSIHACSSLCAAFNNVKSITPSPKHTELSTARALASTMIGMRPTLSCEKIGK